MGHDKSGSGVRLRLHLPETWHTPSALAPCCSTRHPTQLRHGNGYAILAAPLSAALGPELIPLVSQMRYENGTLMSSTLVDQIRAHQRSAVA